MKYLFIFLPFFAAAQDTIAFPDGDTLIHGKLTYGGNSALYGVRFDSVLEHKITSSSSSAGLYYSGDLKLEDGTLYRYVTPRDTLIPVKPRMMEYTTWGGGWKYCDEHLKEGEIGPWRDSSSVNVLIWDGCKLIQKKVDKFENYTYSGDSFLFKNTLQPIRENYSVQYAYKGRLIKFSYVIKEL